MNNILTGIFLGIKYAHNRKNISTKSNKFRNKKQPGVSPVAIRFQLWVSITRSHFMPQPFHKLF